MTTIEGNYEIADEVIATVAASALDEIDGLRSASASGLANIGRKHYYKGFRIKQEEGKVYLSAKVVATYGYPIQEIGYEACKKIAAKVEELTGLKVEEMRIRVEGVEFEDQN